MSTPMVLYSVDYNMEVTLMRDSKQWLYLWQPRKKPRELSQEGADVIVHRLIRLCPSLDSLYLVRDRLSDYLSIYDGIKEKRDD
jgi:hypothetical protein